MKSFTLLLFLCASAVLSAQPTSVIFIHPDGTGLAHWHAGRLMTVGPDGQLNWDKLERAAVYRAHQKGWLSTSSHAGATVHAYGKKVHPDSYGMDRDQPLISASGSELSIMQEAIANGIPSGIVNSGHIGEPGTGVFLASSESRGDVQGIADKILQSGAKVIFCGGEIHLIPKGEVGVHGGVGRREDGRNLLTEAEERGYAVIFTRDELLALDPGVEKVIGIFAAHDTYTDGTEAKLRELDVPPYKPEAPTFAEMTAKAIEILSQDPDTPFFLVAEEEGTDNFSNYTNASGMIEAVRRADEAIGEALSFMEANPDRRVLTLLAADSDAGNPAIWAPKQLPTDRSLPMTTDTGAALDGVDGSRTKPFVSAPDANGLQHAFGIAWPYGMDMQGAVVAKAHGTGSDQLPVDLDNTGIYTLMHKLLMP